VFDHPPDAHLAQELEGSSQASDTHCVGRAAFQPLRVRVGLGAALDFLVQVGIERVFEHERQLIGALWEGLAAVPSVRDCGPSGPDGRVSLLSFNLEGWDPIEVATVLDQSFGICCRAGLHCAPWAHQALGTFPAGTVRFSVSYFNTLDDVEQAVQAVRALAAAGRG